MRRCLLHDALLEHIVWDRRDGDHVHAWHREALPRLLRAAAQVVAAERLCMCKQLRSAWCSRCVTVPTQHVPTPLACHRRCAATHWAPGAVHCLEARQHACRTMLAARRPDAMLDRTEVKGCFVDCRRSEIIEALDDTSWQCKGYTMIRMGMLPQREMCAASCHLKLFCSDFVWCAPP